jgi:hypothetical protein
LQKPRTTVLVDHSKSSFLKYFLSFFIGLTLITNLHAQTLCDLHGSQTASYTFPAGQFASNLPMSSYSNVKIVFQGDFIVDADISFIGCRLEFNANSQIELNDANDLKITGSKLYSCSGNWNGIDNFNFPVAEGRLDIFFCRFENFRHALRLKGTRIHIESTTFEGGDPNVSAVFHLENLNSFLIRDNNFNLNAGSRGVYSVESNLNFINNNFNGGNIGVEGINSLIDFSGGVFFIFNDKSIY